MIEQEDSVHIEPNDLYLVTQITSKVRRVNPTHEMVLNQKCQVISANKGDNHAVLYLPEVNHGKYIWTSRVVNVSIDKSICDGKFDDVVFIETKNTIYTLKRTNH